MGMRKINLCGCIASHVKIHEASCAGIAHHIREWPASRNVRSSCSEREYASLIPSLPDFSRLIALSTLEEIGIARMAAEIESSKPLEKRENEVSAKTPEICRAFVSAVGAVKAARRTAASRNQRYSTAPARTAVCGSKRHRKLTRGPAARRVNYPLTIKKHIHQAIIKVQ